MHGFSEFECDIEFFKIVQLLDPHQKSVSFVERLKTGSSFGFYMVFIAQAEILTGHPGTRSSSYMYHRHYAEYCTSRITVHFTVYSQIFTCIRDQIIIDRLVCVLQILVYGFILRD